MKAKKQTVKKKVVKKAATPRKAYGNAYG